MGAFWPGYSLSFLKIRLHHASARQAGICTNRLHLKAAAGSEAEHCEDVFPTVPAVVRFNRFHYLNRSRGKSAARATILRER